MNVVCWSWIAKRVFCDLETGMNFFLVKGMGGGGGRGLRMMGNSFWDESIFEICWLGDYMDLFKARNLVV